MLQYHVWKGPVCIKTKCSSKNVLIVIWVRFFSRYLTNFYMNSANANPKPFPHGDTPPQHCRHDCTDKNLMFFSCLLLLFLLFFPNHQIMFPPECIFFSPLSFPCTYKINMKREVCSKSVHAIWIAEEVEWGSFDSGFGVEGEDREQLWPIFFSLPSFNEVPPFSSPPVVLDEHKT